MRLIKHTISVIFIFLLGNTIRLYSQVSYKSQSNCGEITFEKKLFGREYINKYPGNQIQFYGDWQYGVIYLTNGSIIQNVHLRYNRFLDEVIWIRIPDYEKAILTKELIDKFVLLDESYKETARFVKTNLAQWQPAGKEETYLEELVSGTVSLYGYRRVLMKFQDYSMFPSYMYFVKIQDKLYRIHLSRISLKTLFKQDKSNIKRAIRGVFSLNIKENDLVKIISRYNDLVESGQGCK